MRVAVVGHVEWVTFMRVDHVPAAGEIVHASEWWEIAGGGGAGAAVQLARLAGSCEFFTALGDDDLGRRSMRGLEAAGVTVHTTFRPGSTRRAVTHVDGGGERTITVLGDRLAPNAADPLPWDHLTGCDAVYVTAADAEALSLARAARVMVATARILDLLTAAPVQLDALVGSLTDTSESYTTGALDPPPRLVVRTDGERGGTFEADGGEHGSYSAIPPDGPIVDRYGAGDAFAAGLAYGLGTGLSTTEALGIAARCGAAVVTSRGPYGG
ncbi:MAG TPA: PfkB family carbohydrate kinase [Actinomycetota bacterium]|nr:PfkB family carbohydrate kinase [Actinomycetota bacterium]